MPSRLTTKQFIKRARAKHGDKYDYSRVRYQTAKDNVKIICSNHGSFSQTPDTHLHSTGCPTCGKERQAKSQQLSKEEFITRAEAAHGKGTYDYSRVNYEGIFIEVEIVCSKHEQFWQTPANHIHSTKAAGCPKCGHERTANCMRFSKEEFVAKAEQKHGKGTYDYSLVNYTNYSTPVVIVCPKHGIFRQTPRGHLRPTGCEKCGFERRAESRRFTNEEFVAKAEQKHGKDAYNYSRVDYKNVDTAVLIICSKHGPFPQTPASHLDGGGCPKCGYERMKQKQRRSKEEFIGKAEEVHGKGTYDYSRVDYVNHKTKVEIICPKHEPFWQTPDTHLSRSGCKKCGHERTADRMRFSKEEFIAKAEEVHGKGTYDYSRVDYVDSQTHVEIICPEHGIFRPIPNNHLRERGCPGCAETGFDQTKPASLYYVRIEVGTEPLYKIGVTNRMVEDRFSREIEKVSIIATWEYPFGSEALEKEREVLRTFKNHLYEGEPVLLNGNSEIFEFDVLELDIQS